MSLAGSPPHVSIIIPTFQRRSALKRVLDGVAKQAYPADRLEVLIISDGGDDGSVEMARNRQIGFPLHVLEQANQGPAAARNLGVANAQGPFVLFLDDDVVPLPELVAEHMRAHGQAENQVVIGPLLEAPGRLSPWVRWEARALVEQYDAMDAGRFRATPWQFYTGNASVRLEHLKAAGGFDVSYRRAEDIELGFRLARLGCSFHFHRAAAAIHIASRSYASWLDAARQYGSNDVVFGKVEERVVGEWRHRHPLTRLLAAWSIRHPGAARLLPALAWAGAWSTQMIGQQRLTHLVCSAIFNLHYWFGVTDRLGLNRAEELLAESAVPAGLKSRQEASPPMDHR